MHACMFCMLLDVSVVMYSHNHNPIKNKILPAAVIRYTRCLSLTSHKQYVKQKPHLSWCDGAERKKRTWAGNSSHTEAKKKAKNKDVFSRQNLTHRWSLLDRTWGNDHSKYSKWRWSARTAVTAENKVTFHSWLAETGMTFLVSQDIFTAALLTVRNGGSLESVGCRSLF